MEEAREKTFTELKNAFTNLFRWYNYNKPHKFLKICSDIIFLQTRLPSTCNCIWDFSTIFFKCYKKKNFANSIFTFYGIQISCALFIFGIFSREKNFHISSDQKSILQWCIVIALHIVCFLTSFFSAIFAARIPERARNISFFPFVFRNSKKRQKKNLIESPESSFLPS